MISAFEHPFLSGLLGDEELSGALGPEAEMAAMLTFEAALAEIEGEFGIIPTDAAKAISKAVTEFTPDLARLKAATGRDGVVVPELVRQLRGAVSSNHAAHVHLGATSQDVIDTALVLRVKACLDLLRDRLIGIDVQFATLAERFGANTLMARTRMQPAIPIAVADRIAAWREPIARHLRRLETFKPEVLVVQFGGAAGTLEKLDDKGAEIRKALAEKLHLEDRPQWHSQRDRIAEIANWLSMITGSLGKFGQDVALMAQMGDEIALRGGGASSAMPHKQNPVDAEVLVTLARFNATQLAGIHHAAVHEQERSGSAWTLEWLILPQMLMAAGAATLLTARLVANIEALGRPPAHPA